MLGAAASSPATGTAASLGAGAYASLASSVVASLAAGAAASLAAGAAAGLAAGPATCSGAGGSVSMGEGAAASLGAGTSEPLGAGAAATLSTAVVVPALSGGGAAASSTAALGFAGGTAAMRGGAACGESLFSSRSMCALTGVTLCWELFDVAIHSDLALPQPLMHALPMLAWSGCGAVLFPKSGMYCRNCCWETVCNEAAERAARRGSKTPDAASPPKCWATRVHTDALCTSYDESPESEAVSPFGRG